MPTPIPTWSLDKIHNRYDAEHDCGPDAPVHWYAEDLAWLLGKAIDRINEQDEQIATLKEQLERVVVLNIKVAEQVKRLQDARPR